jgi:hypothetical protein
LKNVNKLKLSLGSLGGGEWLPPYWLIANSS